MAFPVIRAKQHSVRPGTQELDHGPTTGIFGGCLPRVTFAHDLHDFAITGLKTVRQAEKALMHWSCNVCSCTREWQSLLLIALALLDRTHNRTTKGSGLGAHCVIQNKVPFHTCDMLFLQKVFYCKVVRHGAESPFEAGVM